MMLLCLNVLQGLVWLEREKRTGEEVQVVGRGHHAKEQILDFFLNAMGSLWRVF
jgi:hypothetical protein